MKPTNELGNRHSRLVVIERSGIDGSGKAQWKCLCDCGTVIVTTGDRLRSGMTNSCGCYQKDRCSETHTGMKHTDKIRRIISEHVKKSMKNPEIINKISGINHYNFKHGLSKTAAMHTMWAKGYKLKKTNQTPQLTENEKNKLSLYYQVAHQLECQVDHIIPISKGGLHHPDNLQILDEKSNKSKHNKITNECTGIRL